MLRHETCAFVLTHFYCFNPCRNMKISQLESAVSVTTAVSRCSSTPCTIDTAYSSMKQSPVAHVDDYPMNDINGNTDDLNVSMIESDALSTVTVKSTSSLSSSRESTTILGFDEYKTTAADRYLANIKRISEQVAREHSCSPFHAVHSHQFKDAVEQFCKLKEASTTKTKSVKPKVDPSPEVKRVATKRRAENEPDTAPTAKRERRFTSFSSSNRSFAASPLPPPLPPIDAEEVARQAKERIERDRVRQEKLRQRIDDCIIKKYSSSHLFRGCAKGPVCSVCNKADNVARCSGSCALWFHGRCAGDEQVAEPKVRLITGEGAVYDKEAPQVITCQNCRAGVAVQALCFACNEPADPANALIRCVEKHCNKNYHQKCLKLWPQGKFNPTSGAFSCPYHVCQTCESNDVHSNNNHETDRHLIKCISCPASYHRISACIPAGSKLLSDASMICPRHRVYKKKPVNANWCFFCGKTGELVCCETCPATYHNNCLQELNLDPGELYVCEYCESGRLPLYGEIVWAKYSFYKWWPAIIVPPWQIPPNVMRLAQTNYFCICFFGKGKEYAWMCKDTVYRYEDGDSEFENAHALKDNNYRQAVMEAKEFYKIIEATPAVYKIPKKSQTKPNQFRRIKFNKPIAPVRFDNLETSDTECKCRATDEHPCSQFSDCLNHHTFTECQSTCNAGDKCENQRFEKCLYPKLEVRKVGGKGFGLFAGADIECGTFIIEYVGEVINLDEFHRRFERLKQQKSDTYYILSIDGSLFIDAGPKGNDARFINHSCEPNADPQKWTILGVTRIGFFANRDIKTVRDALYTFQLAFI